MSPIQKGLIVFFLLVLYKLILNAVAFFKADTLSLDYINWLTNDDKSGIAGKRIELVRLFQNAGLKDSGIPFSQPTGYFQIATGTASHFQNLFNRDERFVHLTIQAFETAKGVYKSRLMESFSPLFWINTVLFLPASIFRYLGADSQSSFAKLFNMLYWALGAIYVLLEVFSVPVPSWLPLLRNLSER